MQQGFFRAFGMVIYHHHTINRTGATVSSLSVFVCWVSSGKQRRVTFEKRRRVKTLLNFLAEYVGTDRDPRLQNQPAKGYFTDPSLPPTSGP
jgi:hypothetical protein